MANNSEAQKLWIFTEIFYPEMTSTGYIMTKIAQKLSYKYRVEVVCTKSSYNNTTKNEDFIFSNLVINRIKSFTGNKNQNILRALKFIHVSLLFTFKLLFKVKKNEKVLIVTNPAPFIFFASLIKKIKKYELIILVHDVFPENTISAGYFRSEKNFLYSSIKFFFDKAYAGSNKIIVLGRDMKQIFKEKISKFNSDTKIIIIENWADIKNVFPMDHIGDEKIIFQFAGNLGAIQGLEEFTEIVSQVKNPNVEFHFYGDGKLKPKLQNIKTEKQIENLKFFNSYQRTEQNLILNKCDLGIVSLAPKMKGLGVPSKTYNILASGKPVFFIGDEGSEIDLLIKEFDVGYSFDLKNRQSIIEFLENITVSDKIKFMNKGMKARSVAENNFSEEIILKTYYENI